MDVYAAYCRVSTEEQQKNETIDRQLDLLQTYISHNNIVIPSERWYIDEGWSGTLLLRERPDGARLLLDAMEGKITHLLITQVDRLGREDYAAQEAFHRLKSCGIHLISITQPFNYFEPSGQMMASIFSTFAAYDRAELVQKFADAKNTHAKRGRFPQGQVPFGYINKDKILVIEPTQAEVIKMIYKLYLEGLSIRAITQYLSSMNIPSPATYKENWYHNGSGNWCEYTVTKILNSEYYATGQYEYKPPKKSIVIIPIPAIIDSESYIKVRETASLKRQEYAPNGQYRKYLLRGLIKCGICGSTYVGSSNRQGRFFYYRCTKKIKKPDGTACSNSQINAQLIENIVWNDIVKIFSDPQRLIKEVDIFLSESEKQYDTFTEELKDVDTRLAEIESEKKRLLDLYAKGTVDEKDLETSIYERNHAIESLQERRNALSMQLHYRQNEKSLQGMINIADEINEIIESADDRIKRDLFEMLIDHIEIHPIQNQTKGSEIRVFYRIGLNTFNDCYLVR